MSEHKSELDEMMKSPYTEELMKDKRAILKLANSPDAKKLVQLLSQSSGGGLGDAAKAAMGGDTRAFLEIMGKVMKNPEGVKAVEGLNRNISQK